MFPLDLVQLVSYCILKESSPGPGVSWVQFDVGVRTELKQQTEAAAKNPVDTACESDGRDRARLAVPPASSLCAKLR